jgi:hypothetical protein
VCLQNDAIWDKLSLPRRTLDDARILCARCKPSRDEVLRNALCKLSLLCATKKDLDVGEP